MVIADAHQDDSVPDPEDFPGNCDFTMGKELIRRAIDDAQRRGGFDAVTLLGDLVNDGSKPQTDSVLAEIRDEVQNTIGNADLLVVAGNHDFGTDRFLSIFGQTPGLNQIGDYNFFVFADRFDEDFCTRSEEEMKNLTELASKDPKPIIALQHNPIYPTIDSDYPFMHTNNADVFANYIEAGVMLSVSGHYHPGQELVEKEGVKFITAPAICEPPHKYLLVTLEGQNVEIETCQLLVDKNVAAFDCHAHSQYAYCTKDLTVENVIRRCRHFGLAGVSITEHAPQLYCKDDDFWNARHIYKPSVWKSSKHSRMEQFREFADSLRNEYVKIGLEVELDCEGNLTLHEQDRQWADIIVGAIHWLPVERDKLSEDEFVKLFMETNNRILAAGVDVLAHPWRCFKRIFRQVPEELCQKLVDWLYETNTAAEINFHINQPEKVFFEACVARGVKIAFGSDAHEMHEAAALSAHVALLEEIAGKDSLPNFLYWPG